MNQRPTPEERRLALMKTQRETMRVVKRTLLALAIIAGGYYLYLLKTQSQDVSINDDVDKGKIERVVETVPR